jgi:hypothetical protein
MAPSQRQIRYLKILLACLLLASLALVETSLFLTFLVLSTIFWIAISHRGSIAVKKIRYNKDTKKFEVYVENTGIVPVWLNYSIRSIQPMPVEQQIKSESGIEYMKGGTMDYQENYDLLSEDFFGKIVYPGELTLLESRNLAEDAAWNPKLSNFVQFTALCGDQQSKKTVGINAKIPLEVCGTHPYLRNIGLEREFVLTKADGAAVARANSLKELALKMSENPDCFLLHWNRGDIQKWVKEAIGDVEFADKLSKVEVDEKKLLENFEKMVKKRFVELNYGDFSGKHPLLNDVEEEHAFYVKVGENQVVGVATSLGSLHDVLKTAPVEAFGFHLAKTNDFAKWASVVLGDEQLSRKLGEVDTSNLEYAKLSVLEILSQRIRELGG